jgi:glycosyltransferase involved in cell wall biosynthesis
MRSTSRSRASSCSAAEVGSPSRTVVVAANSAWNIANFRGGLIRGLLAAGYRPVVIAPPDASSEARIAAMGAELIPIAIDRSGLNPAADLRLFATYRHHLRQLRPAAFLGFTVKPNIYGSLAATSLGIPAIPNVSGLGTAFIRKGPLERLVGALYRLAFRRARVVMFQNGDDQALFVQRRIVDKTKTRVLPGSGVNLDRFAPAPLPRNETILLLIARLLRDKGVVELVEAARRIRTDLPHVRVQLLGPLDEANRTSISQTELDSWIQEAAVEYLGATDDVRPHVAAASAVVLPSYREGLPRSLLEAAAMGRPLIATDVPGCREVVEEGVNGYLCAARDILSLEQAMRTFVALPHQDREKMGRASRAKVQDRFSEEIVVQTYLDVLAALLTTEG